MRLQKHTCSLAHQGGGGSSSGAVPGAASKKKYAFKRLSKVNVVQTGGKVFKGDVGVIAGFYHDPSSSVPSYYLYRIRDKKLIGGVKENVLREQVGGDEVADLFSFIYLNNEECKVKISLVVGAAGLEVDIDKAAEKLMTGPHYYERDDGIPFWINIEEGWVKARLNGPVKIHVDENGNKILCYPFQLKDGKIKHVPLECMLPDTSVGDIEEGNAVDVDVDVGPSPDTSATPTADIQERISELRGRMMVSWDDAEIKELQTNITTLESQISSQSSPSATLQSPPATIVTTPPATLQSPPATIVTTPPTLSKADIQERISELRGRMMVSSDAAEMIELQTAIDHCKALL
jgi:hypothetical protein